MNVDKNQIHAARWDDIDDTGNPCPCCGAMPWEEHDLDCPWGDVKVPPDIFDVNC